jgi:hypothetical protein
MNTQEIESKQEIEFTKRPCIVVRGSISSGFEFIGPFHNWDEANHFAKHNAVCLSWGYVIEPLKEPEP